MSSDRTSVEDSLELDEALCFALYTASRAVTTFYRPMLDELGLTYPQYLVMLVLWKRGSVAVKELAEALQLDYGTLSPLLKRLESNGLISRRRRSEDERSVQVILTDSGIALRVRAEGIPALIADATNLDPGSFDALRETLHRLTTAVTERRIERRLARDRVVVDKQPSPAHPVRTQS